MSNVLLRFDSCKIHGRVKFLSPTSAELWWANSGFSFSTNAKGIILSFGPYEDDRFPAYLKISINGEAKRYPVGQKAAPLSISLSEQESCVEVLKITDPEAAVIVSSIELAGDDIYIKPLPQKEKRLLFIGDSISNGFGILGDSKNPIFHPRDMDSTEAYPYRLGRYFDADIMCQSFSGRGIVNDYAGNLSSLTLGEAFASLTPRKEPYDLASFVPDMVFINAGTNDCWGGVNYEEFVVKGTELLEKIRSAYPLASIVYFYGAMDVNLLPTVEKMVLDFQKNHEKVYLIPTRPISLKRGEVGSAGHPSVKANERFFEEIVQALQKKEKRPGQFR